MNAFYACAQFDLRAEAPSRGVTQKFRSVASDEEPIIPRIRSMLSNSQ
jgi:hypothetical protein